TTDCPPQSRLRFQNAAHRRGGVNETPEPFVSTARRVGLDLQQAQAAAGSSTKGPMIMTSNVPADDGPTSDAPAETELTGPALENPEMHLATDDLQSSEAKSAEARKIAVSLTRSPQRARPFP